MAVALWRVEDEYSQTYSDKHGIRAAWKSGLNFNRPKYLRGPLEKHLNWGSWERSPFISAYSKKDVAYCEARRRKRQGRHNVKVVEIVADTRKHGIGAFRKIRKLAELLDVDIRDGAWHNSEHECIFLHCIPWHIIKGVNYI